MSELEKLKKLEALVSTLDVSESDESDEESADEEKISQPFLKTSEPLVTLKISEPVLKTAEPCVKEKISESVFKTSEPSGKGKLSEPVLKTAEPCVKEKISESVFKTSEPFVKEKISEPVLKTSKPSGKGNLSEPVLKTAEPSVLKEDGESKIPSGLGANKSLGLENTVSRSDTLSELFLSVDNVVNIARHRIEVDEEEEEDDDDDEDDEELKPKKSPMNGKKERSLASLTDIVYEEDGNISFPFEVGEDNFEDLEDIKDQQEFMNLEGIGSDEGRESDNGSDIEKVRISLNLSNFHDQVIGIVVDIVNLER